MRRKFLVVFLGLIICYSSQVEGQVRKEVIVHQQYIFKNLYQIFEHLERYYDLEFDYLEEDIPDKLMRTQTFNKVPLDEVVAHLISSYDLDFTIKGNRTVIIRPKGSELLESVKRAIIDPTKFDFTLRGKIIDANSGEALPYATILVKTTLKGTSANVDGNFTLLDTPSDTSTVLLQYLGYKSKYVKLESELLKDDNYIIFEMEPLTNLMEEIVVTDQKEHMIKASETVSKISISPAQLSALPSLGEKDIFRSLQLLPGISATNETSSGLYVRGGTPDQNLVLFDGFTVYHVDHFYGFFSAFNANAVKNVQLYKGGYEAKFGGRLSSVVDLTGKDGNTKNFSGSVGLSALSANLSFESPFKEGKGSMFFSLRRSYTDIIQSGLYSNLYDLFQDENNNTSQGSGRSGFGGRGFGQVQTQPSFYFYDLNGKVSYRPRAGEIISFSVYSGKDKLDNSNDFDSNQFGFGGGGGGPGGFDNSFNDDNVDLNDWGNVGTSLKWGKQWNPRLYSNTVLSYSNYFSNREQYSETDITRQDTSFTTRTGSIENNDIRDVTLKIDNEFLLNPTSRLSFGAQITYNNVQYYNTSNDTLTILDRNDNGLTSALYLDNSWIPFNNFELKPGVRFSHYSESGKIYFEPRISGSYQITEKLKAKGAWGIYNQFITRVVREDVSQGSRDFWLLANDGLNSVSSSTHYIAGLSYETTNFLFDVESYYKDLRGLSEYTLRFSNDFRSRSVQLDELFYEGSGYARGIEFLAQKKFGVYTGWMSYTLSEVIHTFPGLSDNPYPALHDQTHEYKFVNSLRLGRWSFSGTWVFSTGKPYTTPVGGYDLTLLDGNSTSYISVGEKNAYRMDNYHRLDLSAVYNIKFDDITTTNADVGISIFNVYNRNNTWYKTFEIIEEDIVTTDVNTIGITPNIFFTINF